MKHCLLSALLIIGLTTLYASNDELVVVFPSQFIELDPHRAFNTTEAQIFTALYEGLISFDPQTLRPIAAAAQRWEISDDNKTYTFYLKEAMRFSDGTPLTALSFYRSFLRLLSPSVIKHYASNLDVIVGAQNYRLGKTDEQQLGIKVLSDLVLEITLINPTPYFLSILAHFSLSPISQGQLPNSWDNPMKIAYSGPYIISAISSDELTLVKNPFYWDKDAVQIPTIRLQFKSDPQQVTRDFNHYKVDWVTYGAFDSRLADIKNSLRINAQFASSYYFFASNHKAFKNDLVRLALIQALPLTLIRSQEVLKAQSLIPPIANFPQNKGIQENKALAIKTLKKAGHDKGKGLPPITIAAFNEGDAISLAIKESWESLGLTVEIIVPSDNYYGYIEEHRPTLAMMNWVGDYLDPHTFLTMWRSRSPLNYSIFRDNAFDALLDASDYQSGSERFKTLADAEALLLDSGAVIPLGHAPSINLIDIISIDRWYDNPLDIHPFKYLRFRNATTLGITVT